MRKPLISGFGIISVLISSLNSCSTYEQQKEKIINMPSTARKIGAVYMLTWNGEWGRISKACRGNGLCHFTMCLFCGPKGNSSKAEIDDGTGRGVMYIELVQDGFKQSKAIANREILYIDEDMASENVILHKGTYTFDPSIGRHGGYRINIRIKSSTDFNKW